VSNRGLVAEPHENFVTELGSNINTFLLKTTTRPSPTTGTPSGTIFGCGGHLKHLSADQVFMPPTPVLEYRCVLFVEDEAARRRSVSCVPRENSFQG
jgi:hypothetical protein